MTISLLTLFLKQGRLLFQLKAFDHVNRVVKLAMELKGTWSKEMERKRLSIASTDEEA